MWRLRLNADDAAIASLQRQVPDESAGIRFLKSGEHWLLGSNSTATEAEAKDALAAGNLILDHLNFGASLRYPHHLPVEHASTVVDENGAAHHFVTARGTISVTSAGTAKVSGGGPLPTSRSRTEAELVVDLADLVAEVVEVAQIWAQGYNPVALYKIYEIIQSHDRNGPCDIGRLTEKTKTRRFKHTANHPGGAGDRARHARSADEPPANPMSESEMVQYVADLVRAWLKCLAPQYDIPVEAPVQNP